ncbi:MAG: hypothetical protein JWP06_1149 [Candidatus Saccharibacteria bacterium]|nr:hypothetical protein [Candidatus Saccharibacteria bacterium]
MGAFPLDAGFRYNIRRDAKIFPLIIRNLFVAYNRLQQIEIAVPLAQGNMLSIVFTEFTPKRGSSNVFFKGEVTNGEASMKLKGELYFPTGGWLIASRS